MTARTQETYTKLFQEEKERPVFIAVDQRRSMFFGSQYQVKSVTAARLAAAIAWASHANRDRIGAVVFNDHNQADLRAKQGKFALLKFIHTLSDFNAELAVAQATGGSPTISLRLVLEELLRVARPGSLVHVVSDFYDFDRHCEQTLSMLSRHCTVELLKVFDPIERQLPNLSLIHI